MTTRLLTRAALLGALLLVLSPLGPTTGAASASCAGPQLDLEPDQVLGPGIEVTGEWFLDGCQDTGSCSGLAGCTHCTYGPEPRPLTDVPLRLRQDGRTWLLDRTDADDAGRVAFTVTLPPGARAGRAVLTTAYGSRHVVRLAP